MNEKSPGELDEFRRMLAQTTPEDFDGHTEFPRLTPEQKLEWLAEGARFIIELRGLGAVASPVSD